MLLISTVDTASLSPLLVTPKIVVCKMVGGAFTWCSLDEYLAPGLGKKSTSHLLLADLHIGAVGR